MQMELVQLQFLAIVWMYDFPNVSFSYVTHHSVDDRRWVLLIATVHVQILWAGDFKVIAA